MDFRGATVEDLDLLPALTIFPKAQLIEALELSYENSYSYLPVISSKNKRLLGYLTAEQLQKQANISESDLVSNHYTKFSSQPDKRPFRKICPDTPLEDLQKFFEAGESFAVVTDNDRRFVLGVATKEDLDKFIKSRPLVK